MENGLQTCISTKKYWATSLALKRDPQLVSNVLEKDVARMIWDREGRCILYEGFESVILENKYDLEGSRRYAPALSSNEKWQQCHTSVWIFPIISRVRFVVKCCLQSWRRTVCNFIEHLEAAVLKDRMTILPSTTLKQNVFWGALQSPKLWNTSNSLAIRSKDGQRNWQATKFWDHSDSSPQWQQCKGFVGPLWSSVQKGK